MSLCACGAESKKIRQFWDRGKLTREECPACAPQSFEKQTDPSAKKIWIGPEFAPNDYIKREDPDGGYRYDLKPEAARELELQHTVNSQRATDEREARERAMAAKRSTRRTNPMTSEEIEQAIRFADTHLRPMIENEEASFDV